MIVALKGSDSSDFGLKNHSRLILVIRKANWYYEPEVSAFTASKYYNHKIEVRTQHQIHRPHVEHYDFDLVTVSKSHVTYVCIHTSTIIIK